MRIADSAIPSRAELTKIATELDVPGATGMRKQELIFEILKTRAEIRKFDLHTGDTVSLRKRRPRWSCALNVLTGRP